jgi:G3E family GTPase
MSESPLLEQPYSFHNHNYDENFDDMGTQHQSNEQTMRDYGFAETTAGGNGGLDLSFAAASPVNMTPSHSQPSHHQHHNQHHHQHHHQQSGLLTTQASSPYSYPSSTTASLSPHVRRVQNRASLPTRQQQLAWSATVASTPPYEVDLMGPALSPANAAYNFTSNQ